MGALGIGQNVARQAKAAYSTAADMEHRRELANKQLEAGESAQKSSLIGTGAGVGLMAGMGSAAMGAKFGAWAGPVGMAIGAGLGLLAGELF